MRCREGRWRSGDGAGERSGTEGIQRCGRGPIELRGREEEEEADTQRVNPGLLKVGAGAGVETTVVSENWMLQTNATPGRPRPAIAIAIVDPPESDPSTYIHTYYLKSYLPDRLTSVISDHPPPTTNLSSRQSSKTNYGCHGRGRAFHQERLGRS